MLPLQIQAAQRANVRLTLVEIAAFTRISPKIEPSFAGLPEGKGVAAVRVTLIPGPAAGYCWVKFPEVPNNGLEIAPEFNQLQPPAVTVERMVQVEAIHDVDNCHRDSTPCGLPRVIVSPQWGPATHDLDPTPVRKGRPLL